MNANQEKRSIYLESKRGPIRFETNFSITDAITVLDAAPARDRNDFVLDLMHRARRGAYLSSKQEGWLLFFAHQAWERANTEPENSLPTTRIDLTRIIGLFNTARSHIRWPKIRLSTVDGRPVVVKITERGNHPGSLTAATGEPFGTPGSFYGYVFPDGSTSIKDSAVLEVLAKFADNPENVAAEYGHGSGNCTFCGRELSNSELGSVEIGYGPVCAAHYGLPWEPNGKGYEFKEGAPVIPAPAAPKSKPKRSRKSA